MTHEEILELVTAEALGESLRPVDSELVAVHLAECEPCRQESGAIRDLWHDLGGLETEVPTTAMRARFEGMVAGYRETRGSGGESSGEGRVVAGPSSRRLVVQVGLNLAALLAGLLIGIGFRAAPPPDRELAQLQEEVRSLNELVALSLLREGSATDRIRGAHYSSRVGEPDADVVRALVSTATADPDINVRLAAVEALAPLAARPSVRQRLIDSLRAQDSPLVQISLVELLLGSGGDRAASAVNELLADPSLHPEVRRFIAENIGESV